MYEILRATINGLNFKNNEDKSGFWDEAARHVTMMDGMIVRDKKKCPDELFYDETAPKLWKDLRIFGEMEIVKL